MATQNFKNHTKWVPLYHFVLFLLMLAGLILAIINLIKGISLLSVLLLILAISVVLGSFFTRIFALRAQDRAIRAEESLRYFSMTGKLLNPSLTIHQIIALRFASNDEFVELTAKALQSNMSAKEIKQAIQHWRADLYRV